MKVLELLPKLTDKGEITEKLILNIHHRLTKGVLDYPGDSGVYRNKQVVIGNRFTGRITFRPPDAGKVPALLKEFIIWLNSDDISEINAVIVSGISHYEFVRIHPFIDGNGRTARVLASLIIYLRGFDTKRFFALDDYYDGDRPAYYNALQSVDSKKPDTTELLEYFTDGVALQVEKIKEKVLSLSGDRKKKEIKGQVALTERQMRSWSELIQMGRLQTEMLEGCLNSQMRGR